MGVLRARVGGSWVDILSSVGPVNTVRTSTAAPTAGDGQDGDFWINSTAWTISGPKAAGVWPTAVSMVGPAGSPGSAGLIVLATGAPVPGGTPAGTVVVRT